MYSHTRIGFVGLAVASLALAACTTPEPIDPNDTGFIPGGDYVLVGMDGGAIPQRNITLHVGENQISGHGPCNGYAAQNTFELPALALTPIQSPRIPCKDSELENHYFSVLQSANSMEFYGGVLKVKSPQTWLIYERGIPKADADSVSALERARAEQ